MFRSILSPFKYSSKSWDLTVGKDVQVGFLVAKGGSSIPYGYVPLLLLNKLIPFHLTKFIHTTLNPTCQSVSLSACQPIINVCIHLSINQHWGISSLLWSKTAGKELSYVVLSLTFLYFLLTLSLLSFYSLWIILFSFLNWNDNF